MKGKFASTLMLVVAAFVFINTSALAATKESVSSTTSATLKDLFQSPAVEHPVSCQVQAYAPPYLSDEPSFVSYKKWLDRLEQKTKRVVVSGSAELYSLQETASGKMDQLLISRKKTLDEAKTKFIILNKNCLDQKSLTKARGEALQIKNNFTDDLKEARQQRTSKIRRIKTTIKKRLKQIVQKSKRGQKLLRKKQRRISSIRANHRQAVKDMKKKYRKELLSILSQHNNYLATTSAEEANALGQENYKDEYASLSSDRALTRALGALAKKKTKQLVVDEKNWRRAKKQQSRQGIVARKTKRIASTSLLFDTSLMSKETTEVLLEEKRLESDKIALENNLLVELRGQKPVAQIPELKATETMRIGTTGSAATCPQDCSVLARISAIQGRVNKERNSHVIQKDGLITHFSLGLGKPNAKQQKDLSRFGKTPKASLLVMEKSQSGYRFKIVAKSPVVDLSRHLGRTARFSLKKPLEVKRGQFIGITTPTWAPIFAAGNNIHSDSNRWRASRSRDKCADKYLTQTLPHDRLNSSEQYGCQFNANLLYSATIVSEKQK